jgi:hypothetical protein
MTGNAANQPKVPAPMQMAAFSACGAALRRERDAAVAEAEALREKIEARASSPPAPPGPISLPSMQVPKYTRLAG